ncbi:HEXXH motif domain-containing protein [Streptomyces sp. NBC_01210]|uniref:HEXXH motif domain-containing protein n=1 Tax=Streptomyces sp. NBC_01210 TaxID=2903774 RepID=UPI002E1133DD|nr:HEXXH motif domain-containing protein [Streptomyces sp. NBC_01210]
MKIGMHGLLQADLAQLAEGAGDPTTLLRLCEAERSKHILLLHSVIAEAGRRFPAAHDELELAGAWALLNRVQQKAPDILTKVLQMPQLGAWAVDCLLRLEHVESDSLALRADLSQAGAFAAVAGVRAGLDFNLPVALPDGLLVLPGLGSLCTPVRGYARLRHSGVRLELVTGEAAMGLPAMRPPSVVARHAGLSLELDVDSSTPYLDRYRHPRLATVDHRELRQWSERFAGAWRILAAHHRNDAEAISVSMRTVVPLQADRTGSTVAATSPSTFGAVATSLPSDDLTLAETLVHEFQHLKLCAVLDLLPLVDSRKGELAYAPWRDDPRPSRGLLHGAYAYLGVTRFWRTQRWHMPADQALRGHAEFVRRCAETLGVVKSLLASSRLTAEGERFVAAAGLQLRRWQRDPAPKAARRIALRASYEHRTTWEARHTVVDPESVDRLVARWTAGRPPDVAEWSSVPSRIRSAGVQCSHPRGMLLTLGYVDPPRARRLLDEEAQGGPANLGLSKADAALLRGDLLTAVAAYRSEIRRRPVEPEVWAGLALAVKWSSDPAAAFLCRRVPLAIALHAAIHDTTGDLIDPLELADWLANNEPRRRAS